MLYCLCYESIRNVSIFIITFYKLEFHDYIVYIQGDTVAELMLRHAKYNQCKDVKAFKKELGEIVFEARKNTISLGQVFDKKD